MTSPQTNVMQLLNTVAATLVLTCCATGVRAADYPAPKVGDWMATNVQFHTGEVLPRVRLHYRTVGAPTGMPVLVLHASTGSGDAMLGAGFGGELFGRGQPLDAEKYFIVIPDALGAGQSSKPSDGLRASFPQYSVEDLVRAQYRLLTEHLGVTHLRLVLGVSGGGMQTWLWGELYPAFMDALVPMASMPMPMSGRNWIARRMLIDMIRNDPGYMNGDYRVQPAGLKSAIAYFGLLTSGGTRGLQKAAPTRERADELIAQRLAQNTAADANDLIYQYEAARDYDPSPRLEQIRSTLLVINSADDERNPPELRAVEGALRRVAGGRYFEIAASAETAGHGTAMTARLWKDELLSLLPSLAPYRR